MNFNYGTQAQDRFKLHNTKTVTLASGETKHKADITDADLEANWVALKAERDRCYKALFDNELDLLKFVGIKTYRDEWDKKWMDFNNNYGEHFKEHLHQHCKRVAVKQTDHPEYNSVEIWERIQTFIMYKIEGDLHEEKKVQAAYADQTEKEGGN